MTDPSTSHGHHRRRHHRVRRSAAAENLSPLIIDQVPVVPLLSSSDPLCQAVIHNLWHVDPDDYLTWVTHNVPDTHLLVVLIDSSLLITTLAIRTVTDQTELEESGLIDPDPDNEQATTPLDLSDITTEVVEHAADIALHNPVAEDNVVFCCGHDDLHLLDIANGVNGIISYVSAGFVLEDVSGDVSQLEQMEPDQVLSKVADRQWLTDELIEQETDRLLEQTTDIDADEIVVVCPIHNCVPHEGPVTIHIPIFDGSTVALRRAVNTTIRLVGFCGGVVFGWDTNEDDYTGDAWVFTPGGMVAVEHPEAVAVADSYVQ